MDWTKYSATPPKNEGWYLVGYSSEAGSNYWLGWIYKALYWHAGKEIWTEDARLPAAGGIRVEPPIELWKEILCLEEAA